MNIKAKNFFIVDQEWAIWLWFFHTKAMALDFDSFYQYILSIMLGDREFYKEFLLPLAQLLKIKNGVPADKFYKKLREILPPPPSELKKMGIL